jgi:adenine-specific DNA-methyltransferase
MASFVYSVSYVSNTSGVFKGFHRGWGGSNGTAQYRICSDIELRPALTFDNGKKNFSTREDAGKLVLELTNILGEIPDIVYLDPPYNQHPYGSNYHVLNTVTLWDKPNFPKKITRGTKSAIRLDWRTERRSAYNSQRKAAQEFQELIDNITAKYILTSYSTEGNIPLEEMMRILGSKGSLRIVKREYVRYRVSPTRLSPKPRNVEFVVITDTNGKPESIESLKEIVSELRRIDSEITNPSELIQ